ncbi:MAG: hypothetical protein R6V23_08705 [Bacteroidales bacterium]
MKAKETIENAVFTKKSKNALIDETLGRFHLLMNETFHGNDSNNFKKEFPQNIHFEDLKYKLDDVVIYIGSFKSSEVSIEVILDIFHHNSTSELGTFSEIFNEDGVLIDELLVIN